MKPIKGYEGLYSITEDGRVYSERQKKFMRPFTTKKGYLRITLQKDRIYKNYLIHRLVAEAFLENPNNLPIINHKDENKQNNCIDNLEYCTNEYNITYSKGKSVYCVELDKTFSSINAAAKEIGVSAGSLSACLKRNNGKCIYTKLHFEYVSK